MIIIQLDYIVEEMKVFILQKELFYTKTYIISNATENSELQ